MEVLTEKKVIVGTSILQELVSKAIKCCTFMGNSFPLTCSIEIKIQNDKLSVRTTDNVNDLVLTANVQAEDFEVVVDAKLFSQLVSKITSPTTTLVVTDKVLTVIANGKYNIELPQDPATDELVSFPDIDVEFKGQPTRITNEQLKSILSLNKVCKSEMKEMPALYNYYFDDKYVMTTDYYKVCLNPMNIFKSAVSLSPNLVELVPLVSDENGVTIYHNDSDVVFVSTKGILYGKAETQELAESFPANDILQLFAEEYTNKCIINKTLLLNALNRICLFTSPFESNKINVSLNENSITLFSETSNSSETINYLQAIPLEAGKEIKVDLIMDATFLRSMISSYLKEDIIIKFGSEAGIQLVCDDVVQLLGKLSDEEASI